MKAISLTVFVSKGVDIMDRCDQQTKDLMFLDDLVRNGTVKIQGCFKSIHKIMREVEGIVGEMDLALETYKNIDYHNQDNEEQ